MTTHRLARVALVLAVLLAFGAIAVSNGASPVTRVVLGSGDPPETGDDELALSKVTVPAGASLAAHTHPGLQIATIRSGRLTYTVVRGRASVRRVSGRVVSVRAGRTVVLRPGDTITEPKGMVHRARNRGRSRVVIVLASLFPAGAPISTPAGGASAR
jgi:quercetin dioxygenase-like cupin family protein